MEIIFVRHGESEGNAFSGRDKVFCGQWDYPLTERGYRQAKALAGNSLFEHAEAFFVSDLKRAVETARSITNTELTMDPRLRERSLGEFEGKKVEVIMNAPQYAGYFTDPALSSFRNSFTEKAPHGENYSDVCNRVRPFLQELIRQGYHKVVIISHSVAIRCMIKEIRGLSEEETLSLDVPNCFPIKLVWQPGISPCAEADESGEQTK